MYKKISLDKAPRRKRTSTFRFEGTPEWKAMKRDIDTGLKPNEGLQVALSPEDKEKYNIASRRTIARFINRYLKSVKKPYTVQSFNRDGLDFFIVKYQPVIAKTA